MLLYLVFTITLPNWDGQIDSLFYKYRNRSEEQFSSDVYNIQKVVQENSKDDEKITVYGNSNIIYLASERMSASRYSYQVPLGNVRPEIMDEYFMELENEPPKLIIVAKRRGMDMERMLNFIDKYNYDLIYTRLHEDGTGVFASVYKKSQ